MEESPDPLDLGVEAGGELASTPPLESLWSEVEDVVEEPLAKIADDALLHCAHGLRASQFRGAAEHRNTDQACHNRLPSKARKKIDLIRRRLRLSGFFAESERRDQGPREHRVGAGGDRGEHHDHQCAKYCEPTLTNPVLEEGPRRACI